MTDLTLIGYWRNDQHPEYPHPADFVDDSWDDDERELVAEYLAGGLPVVHMMGFSACRLCSKELNGNSELTDGTYLWPEGLAHYVLDHKVRLPSVVLHHIRTNFEGLEAAAIQTHERGLRSWLDLARPGV